MNWNLSYGMNNEANMPPDKNTIILPDRSNHLAHYSHDRSLGYHPRIIAANRHTYRDQGCIYGNDHQYDLSYCSRCSLDTLRGCPYSAYRPLNIASGKSHDGQGHLLLDYLDSERYLLDPDTMERILHPVTYRTIKVIDMAKSFAVLRQAFGYKGEDEDFAPDPPSHIKEAA